MKKLLSVILVTCLVCGACSFSVLANDSVEISGNKLTKNQAITAFETGSIESVNSRSSSADRAVIQVNETVITGENVTISGMVSEIGENVPFNLTGKLYKSVLQEKGIDAYCGSLKDTTGNFEVLHFFVKKDKDYYQYVLNETLRNEKIFLLYLRDSAGNIFTFEEELDVLNLTSTSNITSSKVAETSDDILWFGKVIPGEYKEVEMPVSRSVYNREVYTPVVQRNSTYYGQAWNENANGKVWTYVGDVATAGDSPFKTSLKLEESLYIDGVYQGTSTNFTIQEDPTIPLTLNFGVGYNSTWNYSYWTGTYWKSGSSAQSPSISVDFGWAYGPLSASCSLLTLNFDGDSLVKNTNFTAPDTASCKNLGLEIPISRKLYLKNDGDRIDFIGSVSTIDSSQTANKTTSAITAWSFQINYLPDTPNHIRHTAVNLGSTVSYISNVK